MTTGSATRLPTRTDEISGLTLPSSGRAFGTPLKSNVRPHKIATSKPECVESPFDSPHNPQSIRHHYDRQSSLKEEHNA